MKNLLKNNFFLLMLGIVLFGVVLSACGTSSKDGADEPETEDPATDKSEDEADEPKKEPIEAKDAQGNLIEENPIVTITMDDGAEISIELFPQIAPNTVNNFVSLAEAGFYDGVIFHRVDPGFMIQGGDPDGVGTGGPGYGIKGEFSLNGFENELAHKRGVISMARSRHLDSAGSQFFIMHGDSPHLDGEYASFGQVIEGMDVVDAIATTERAQEKPLVEQRMKTVTVDTKGYEYAKPEEIK